MTKAESPFLEISVQTTSDSEQNLKEILTVIANRNELSPYNTVLWKGTDTNPILRLDYSSYADFELSYREGEEQMLKFLNMLEDGSLNIEKVKESLEQEDLKGKKWKSVSYEEMYLILKYRTNYKAPLRQNYLFSEWFIGFFREHIMYEEIDDGFLIFFHRKADFTNSNLNKTNPVELRQWLQSKNIKIDSNFMKQILKMVQS
ncbi:MAG: hypothetical protein ACTSYI_12620 [Promethearchaeota archaeon]